jgi:hypothetical protein
MASTHELTPITCENCGGETFVEETTTTELVRGKFALTENAILLVEASDGPPEPREVWASLSCDHCQHRWYDADHVSEWQVSRTRAVEEEEEEFLRALEAAKPDPDDLVAQRTDEELEAVAAADRAEWISPIGEDAGADPRQIKRIRERLRSAASDRVHEYPPEKLMQLLHDARFLDEMLRREQMRRSLIEMAETQNEAEDGSGRDA